MSCPDKHSTAFRYRLSLYRDQLNNKTDEIQGIDIMYIKQSLGPNALSVRQHIKGTVWPLFYNFSKLLSIPTATIIVRIKNHMQTSAEEKYESVAGSSFVEEGLSEVRVTLHPTMHRDFAVFFRQNTCLKKQGALLLAINRTKGLKYLPGYTSLSDYYCQSLTIYHYIKVRWLTIKLKKYD